MSPKLDDPSLNNVCGKETKHRPHGSREKCSSIHASVCKYPAAETAVIGVFSLSH